MSSRSIGLPPHVGPVGRMDAYPSHTKMWKSIKVHVPGNDRSETVILPLVSCGLCWGWDRNQPHTCTSCHRFHEHLKTLFKKTVSYVRVKLSRQTKMRWDLRIKEEGKEWNDATLTFAWIRMALSTSFSLYWNSISGFFRLDRVDLIALGAAFGTWMSASRGKWR